MSLRYVPPNTPSLIISTGVLFAPKSVYKTPSSSNADLLTALFLLTPHKIHLKSTHFTFNIAIFFNFEKIHPILYLLQIFY